MSTWLTTSNLWLFGAVTRSRPSAVRTSATVATPHMPRPLPPRETAIPRKTGNSAHPRRPAKARNHDWRGKGMGAPTARAIPDTCSRASASSGRSASCGVLRPQPSTLSSPLGTSMRPGGGVCTSRDGTHSTAPGAGHEPHSRSVVPNKRRGPLNARTLDEPRSGHRIAAGAIVVSRAITIAPFHSINSEESGNEAHSRCGNCRKIVMFDESETSPSPVLDDGLPPPTHSQIEYWRKLCGALAQVKGLGMADEAWSTNLGGARIRYSSDGTVTYSHIARRLAPPVGFVSTSGRVVTCALHRARGSD